MGGVWDHHNHHIHLSELHATVLGGFVVQKDLWMYNGGRNMVGRSCRHTYAHPTHTRRYIHTYFAVV